jgi:hypothetical protein
MFHKLAVVFLSSLLGANLLAQTTALNGTVTDPSGAVIPNAAITLTHVQTGAQRQAVSDPQGRYNIPQLTSGEYKLTAKASGFSDVTINNVQLLVNQPATVPIVFEKLGATITTVSVESVTTQVNTVDASLGNALNTSTLIQLPLFARNVAGLLQFQPGVVSLGTAATDDRNGAVNGGRADQANVTLDGADVNSQYNRAAFTSVLRVTLDSLEEFRSTTSNGGAEMGRGSGAEIALVTKSGTNDLHGSLYESRRGTETAANDFFNNRSNVPRPALLINVFGGSAGGAIRKNKAFFFLNYEGRREASATIVNRTVPTETVKQGIITFHNTGGALMTVGPNDLKNIDPLGVGVDPASLKIMQAYPRGNNNAIGDQLNTIGYTFNAPVHVDYNTYIAKFDYKLGDGKHSLFWRGTLVNDSQNGTPQFPGQQPNSVTLSNNKGFSGGWTGVLKPNLVSTLNYGFTRVGGETTGILATNYTTFRGFDPIYGTTTGTARIIPVHTISEDISWIHGAHTVRFGGIGRLISNRSVSYRHSFHTAVTNPSVINGSGADITPAALAVATGDRTTYQNTAAALMGIVTTGTGNYNYLVDGTVLPVGAPIGRDWANREGEFYAQDSWRVTHNLTVTAGLRLSLMPPVHEANGQQISTDIPIGYWMDKRGSLAAQGLSNKDAGIITYILANGAGGRSMYPYHKNWSPRIAVAYSPRAEGGLARFLFGGSNRTTIRAGAGLYYDLIGQPLAAAIDATAFGLASTLTTPPNVMTSAQLPRFTDFNSVPTELVPAAPKGGFPAAYPNSFAITNSVDDNLKAPYTMNLNFSIGREFSHGFFAQVAYVGRLSRHSLVQRDLAMPTDLRDPKSGQTYFQAMTQLATLLDLSGVTIANLPRIPFFENMWATAAGNGYSATQAIAKDYKERSNPGDFTNVLSDMDNGANCSVNGSAYSASSGNITRLGCGILGPFSQWSSQFSALNAWSSLGSGAYHGMQLTVRKRLSGGLTFDLNYTLSKSVDIGSRTENTTNFSTDFMINSWNPGQLREVSRFDTLHAVNALGVWDLPLGRNRKFGAHMNRVLDAFIGGWQISGTWRQTSGLPFSVGDGQRWATNWQLSAFATPNGNPVPQTVSAHNAAAISGAPAPNLWTDAKSAFAGFQETMAGQTGSRNSLRGDGFFDIDTGLAKNFTMPYSERHHLQFRWDSFNVTNSVRLDPLSASLSLTTQSSFGKLSGQLGSPRQMQFALRYSF